MLALIRSSAGERAVFVGTFVPLGPVTDELT